MIIEQVVKSFNTIWTYKLFPIAGHDIGVNNIVILFVLLILGLKYIKNLSNKLNNYLIRKLEPSSAHNLSTLIIYAVRVIYIIIVLSIANIPLSGFAFISGALVFALGFGAQTLLTNFISSLIIMSEQLIKIGEVIKVKDTLGTVQSIRMRCTILKTFSNHEVLIPNSELVLNPIEKFNIDNTIFSYQVELTISKQEMSDGVQSFISRLKELCNNIDDTINNEATEIFCINADKENVNFILKLSLDINRVKDIDSIKNKISTELISKIQANSLSIKYSN